MKTVKIILDAGHTPLLLIPNHLRDIARIPTKAPTIILLAHMNFVQGQRLRFQHVGEGQALALSKV